MTRTTNARIAGAAFLVYIAAGVVPKPNEQLADLSTLVMVFCALVLGVTLWSLTRDVDSDVATLGMVCRIIEGAIGAVALAAAFEDTNIVPAAIFFAVGSTLFCWLLLRGRIIPFALAWLGVVASVLLVIVLPLQLTDVVDGMITKAVWAPMALFEVALALWWLVKGANESPATLR